MDRLKYTMLKLAKVLVEKSYGDPSAFLGHNAMQESLDYNMLVKNLVREKVSEIVLSETPIIKVEYSVIVDRGVYERLAVASVPTNQEPPQINEERVEKLLEARKRMTDIPISGFENYAIVHFLLIMNRDDVSVGSLLRSILGKYTFLWFDKEHEGPMIPIIEW